MQPDKTPVEHRNLQDDKLTYCFSSTLFFKRVNGRVMKIDPLQSSYVWIPSLLDLTELQVHQGQETISVLETIREKLEDDGLADVFICYLLVCGKNKKAN